MKIEHLSAASQLASYRLKYYEIVILKHIGLYRKSVPRGFVKHRYISYSAHSHVQRSRYRRSGQRQNVDIPRDLLDLLLLCNPETLFFIDYQQSEVVECYVL